MSTGNGVAAKGLAAGATAIIRIVKESQVLNEDRLELFEAWITWLHNTDRHDAEFLELFVQDVLPPILASANATVLMGSLKLDPDAGHESIQLVRLAARAETLTRFNTLISGLASRLLAPERGKVMETSEKSEQALVGAPGMVGSMPPDL